MRFKVFLISTVALIIGGVFIFGAYGWFLGRQKRVETGAARPTFPYSDYSIEELNRLYPQYANADVPTAQTPEQTHAKFIAALKDGDLDEAVRCCFREGESVEMKRRLEEVRSKDLLEKMTQDLAKIDQEIVGDNSATYSYSSQREGQNFGHIISFIKNSQGVWLIESL